MQVNGKQVDALQWLRDTGGANADKRFTTKQSAAGAAESAKPSLTKDQAALLKNQMKLNKAQVVTGMSSDNISTYLSQLKALQPATQTTAIIDTNSVNFSSPKTNTASISGKNNSVDFRSTTGIVNDNSVTLSGNGNTVRGYNGGQKNNTLAITGDTNRVFAGQGVSGAAVTVKGSNNHVTLAENASNSSVTITGQNVKVSIGSEGLTAGSNQNWKISVAADNVEVTMVNGKASVNMAEDMKDKYKVTIDDTKKTVSVTAV
jgi:hypothetical protein